MSVFRDSFEQCPRCGIDLIDARSARGCRRCNGLWLREDVLTEMVMEMLPVAMHGRLVFTPVRQDDKVGCPSCHEGMELAMLHGIVVDRCAKHGIWFDYEELQGVLRMAARPGGAAILAAAEVSPTPAWHTVQPASPPAPRLPGLSPARPASPAEPAPAGVPALRFRIQRGDDRTEVVVHHEIVKLGRIASAHVRLADDSSAARLHALIEATAADGVWIIDLGSKQQTEVNGEPVTRTRLASGDVITLGDSYVTVEILPA